MDNEDPSNAYAVAWSRAASRRRAGRRYSRSATTDVDHAALRGVRVVGHGSGVFAGRRADSGQWRDRRDGPGARGSPVSRSSAIGNTTGATLTWPAATAAATRWPTTRSTRQTAAAAARWPGRPRRPLNLSGLTIGNSYTYNVVAVDSQGNPSLPSPPVTFTVPAPANRELRRALRGEQHLARRLRRRDHHHQPGGDATSPWTLTFTWPARRGGPGGWNGTWTQTGPTVTVEHRVERHDRGERRHEHRLQRHGHRPGSGADRLLAQRDGVRQQLTARKLCSRTKSRGRWKARSRDWFC